ncbi:uncharacterized protein LOC134235515 isoform X2 [Saccostrea cucullata]|uniref:uncharacterized protein LOC134235515 isoform X2 n=1 Tax=Saccostrea cuccullata TaxID=36930 RepID=UPI002ED0E868
MRCCKQEAVHRGTCGHLLCLKCIIRVEKDITQRVCNVLRCTTVISRDDVQHSYQQAAVTEMWTLLKIPKNQECNIFCKKKAVLVLKSCRHGYCYSCIHAKLMKRIEPSLSGRGERVFRCQETLCPTKISEKVLEQYLSLLSTTALTAAFFLEISTEEWYKCENKSDAEPKVRNRACRRHHAFCLECLTGNKSNTVFKPYLHRGDSGIQVSCIVPNCDSSTPLLALTAFLETLTGKSYKIEIFLRRALISEMCTNCCKQYANVTRVACSHGLCHECVKEIVSEKKYKYNMCKGEYDTCRNVVPISVFQIFVQKESQMDSMNDSEYSRELPKIELRISISESTGSLTLSADVTSSSAITSVTWIHGNQQIEMSESPQKFIENESRTLHPTLVIQNLQKEDAGSYFVKVENKDGVGKSNEVHFPLPNEKTKITIKKIPNQEEKSVILQAKISTKWPVKRLQWQKNRNNLIISNIIMKYVENKSDRHNPVLTIQNFDKSDEGKYRLLAESIDGQVESEEIELSILEERPEIFVNFSIDKEKRIVTFIANIPASLKGAKVRWTKDNKDIDSKQYRKYNWMKLSDAVSKLIVHDITKVDQGEYKAAAECKPMTIWSQPIIFAVPKDAVRVSLEYKFEGNTLLLCADVITNGWPVIKYMWQKDGQAIHPGGRARENYSVIDHPKLVIKNTSESDAGQYTLTVETLAEVKSSASVHVLKPEPVKTKRSKEEYNPDNYTDPQSKIDRFPEECHGIPETQIVMVKNPYTQNKICRLCYELAVVEIENCKHRFCRNCISVLTTKLQSEQKYFTCTLGCKSWISLNALDAFLKRPCAIQLEVPMYFQIKPKTCESCKGDGIIEAKYCNHSLCLDCLQRCKPDEQCEIPSCRNMKLPPKYYYEYLLSSLCSKKIDKDLAFILYPGKCEGLFSNECCVCSAFNCSEKAVCIVIRCGHKICANCVKIAEKKTIKEYRLSFSRCPGPNCCEELFPFSRCCPEGKSFGLNETKQMDHECVATVSGGNKDTGKKHETIDNTTLQQKEVNNKGEEKRGKRKMDSGLIEPVKRQSVENVVTNSESRGLRNIGFSCYRNSILQILAETPYFLERLNQSLLEKKKEWIHSLCLILEGIRTNTTEENIDVLHQFHYEFNKSNPEYREYEQEDCLSFLTSLLNGIQEAFTEKRGAQGDPVDLFRGNWRDRYMCNECSVKEYYNDSEFFYLPLPYTEKKKKEATIGSCFLGLLVEEEIDMFSCSKCGCNKMMKQLDIVHFPLILVLQISKIHEADSTDKECSFEKRRNFVKFWDTFEGLKNRELKQKIGDDTLRPYRLFGVVVHWGSERSGHYICFVKLKVEQKWKRCDDSYVDDASINSVLRSNAYLLFYEKCETSIE